MVQFFNEFWSRDEQLFNNIQLESIMQLLHKLLLNLALGVSILVLVYALFTGTKNIKISADIVQDAHTVTPVVKISNVTNYQMNRAELMKSIHIWCILTKLDQHSNLKTKFQLFFESLVQYSESAVTLHVISDLSGRQFAEDVFDALENSETLLKMEFYDVSTFADKLKPLVSAIQPHFSSSPGSYYSDSLFFMSMGLHKLAPVWMTKCILVDIDTQFRTDPVHLWNRFKEFSNTQIVGLAPELSPVYRHTLSVYRSHTEDSKIGEPSAQGGYSGYNSGVILLNLKRLRNSKIFSDLCETNTVTALVQKYYFRGHLGDQDFYTLLGIERPELIYKLPCTWNRQLCTWWKDHGYYDIFDAFFTCKGKINLYHGNCNTPIPT